jgi:branched-chain amino acid transport system ATP-binding protein
MKGGSLLGENAGSVLSENQQSDVSAHYGAVQALRGVSIRVEEGRTTAILGANGAGKTTLLRAIAGLADLRQGRVLLDGQDIQSVPAHRRRALGLGYAMEGRRIFRDISVQDNLKLAWQFGPHRQPFAQALELVYENFPILKEKARQPAGLLSGGQQQMTILSCATIAQPRYLLLDEPSLGLAPIIVEQIYRYIRAFSSEFGSGVIIAEQMAAVALKVSSTAYVLRRGSVVLEGDSAGILRDGVGQSLSSQYL